MDNFNDEHAGKGGSYVIDADGKRVPAPAAQPAPEPAPVLPVQAKPTSQPKVKRASNA